MESQSPPDSHASTPKRPANVPPAAENVSNAQSSVRFLISNAAAGSVIGKGGATISEFQAQSGSRIQLSRNHEYFPGTTDRIILLSGTINEVLTALHLILTKILNEVNVAEDEHEAEQKPNQVRLVVPNNVCGAIIGKGGATIKSMVEDSRANIKLSSQDQALTGISDRVVTITGTLDQQLRAVALIITKLSEDPNYAQYANAPISYPGTGVLSLQNIRTRFAATSLNAGYPMSISPPPYQLTPTFGSRAKGLMSPLSARSPVQITLPVVQEGPLTTSLTVAVPDERIGAIVGRAGKTITEIQQASGVRIKISDRGDFLAGTKDRKVTISGTAEGVRLAQHLLTQKVQQSMVSDFESGRMSPTPAYL